MAASKRQVRVGSKLEKLLLDIKVKNKVPIWRAGDIVAELALSKKKNKKIKERIIREIEF